MKSSIAPIEVKITLDLEGEKLNFKSKNKLNAEILKKIYEKLEDLGFSEECGSEEECFDWEDVFKDKIKKHSKAGLALRGARYRECLSQKKLSDKSGVSQEDISKIENGKRKVGRKLAEKLAAVLNINPNILLEEKHSEE